MKFTSMLKAQFLIALIALLSSCNLENEVLAPQTVDKPLESREDKQPILENGYLVFENIDHVMTYSSKMESLSDLERENWEESMGFYSMLSDYKSFLSYSEASIETGYDMTLDQIREKYKETLILKDDGDFFLNAPSSITASVLNRQGLVKVGASLQKHMRDKVIVIEDGDLNKLSLASTLDQSDPKQGISIHPVIDNSALKTRCGGISLHSGIESSAKQTYHFYNSWGLKIHGNRNSKYRVQVSVISFSWGVNSSGARSYVNIKTQARGFAGGWYAKSANSVVTVNNASISDNNGFTSTVPNNTVRSDNDNNWSFHLFSVLSQNNPITSISYRNNGESWNLLCYDLRVTSSFSHRNHTHSITVDIN